LHNQFSRLDCAKQGHPALLGASHFLIAFLEHIPKFRNGTGKILANASTPDFSDASDIILGYALSSSRF
jgi:hypothetical protein